MYESVQKMKEEELIKKIKCQVDSEEILQNSREVAQADNNLPNHA